MIRFSIKQSLRTPVRAATAVLISALVCAFFCVALNLQRNAANNIHLLYQDFDVIAVPDFQASVTKTGELSKSSTGLLYQGYLPCYPQDYDLTPLENAPGVKRVQVNGQFGAYVKQDEQLTLGDGYGDRYYVDDVIIFTYNGTEAMVMEGLARGVFESNGGQPTGVTVEWSAMQSDPSCFSPEAIRLDNSNDGLASYLSSGYLEKNGLDEMFLADASGEKDGTFVLEPGKRYIATGYIGSSQMENGKLTVNSFSVTDIHAHAKMEMMYVNGAWVNMPNTNAYAGVLPCILPYTDDFWQTEAGEYYQDAIDICRINANSITAISTDDLSLMRPFHSGKVYLSAGRNFSDEDYQNGNRVCLMSSYLAQANGWSIGDTLDLSFYETSYPLNDLANSVQSYYQPFEQVETADGGYRLEKAHPFFQEDTYQIIGLYDGNVSLNDYSNVLQYNRAEGINRTVIIVPDSSVKNAPKPVISQYSATILLDGRSVPDFMSAMDASGLMKEQSGGYELGLRVYDQGLFSMTQGLTQLEKTSGITLLLACITGVAAIILLAVLTAKQNKKIIAALRSLGVRRRQIPAAVLSGFLLLCLLGACIGSGVGYALSGRVANHILDTAQADLADSAFTAMLAKDASTAVFHPNISSVPLLAVISAAAVLLLLTLLSALLVWQESKKSPILQLGARE